VDKATLLERMKSDLEGDPGLLHACDAVVRHLELQPLEALQFITFGTLSDAAGMSSPYDAVPIAQYLSSARAHLLDRCFLLIVGDEEFDISEEEVEAARRERVLYHPDLGEPIPNFEQSLLVYFTVSSDGKEIVGKAR